MFSACHLSLLRLIKYCISTKVQLVHIFHKVNQLSTNKQTKLKENIMHMVAVTNRLMQYFKQI